MCHPVLLCLVKVWHSDFSALTSVVTSPFTEAGPALLSQCFPGHDASHKLMGMQEERGKCYTTEKRHSTGILILVSLINFYIIKLVTLNRPFQTV